MIVIIKRQFTKDLKALPKHVKEAIINVIDTLNKVDKLSDSNLHYIKLQGQKSGENYYRIRVGDYRIGCELRSPEIIIITLFHRQDNYKSFP